MAVTAQIHRMTTTARTYGKCLYCEGRWVLRDFPPWISIKLKSVFASIHKARTGVFTLPGTDETCVDLLWFFSRYPFETSPADHERLRAGRRGAIKREEDADRIFSPEWSPPPLTGFKEGSAPWPYQAQAADLTDKLGNLLLMDEVGLGKTVSSLALIAREGKIPAAIVVQAHLADQWVEEYIEDFTTLRAHIIKTRAPYKLPPADIYVFKYTNIIGWVELFSTGFFKTAAFDEMQELRTGGAAQKYGAASALCRNTEWRMGLTATPIYNYGSEIFNIVNLLRPGILGSQEEFHIEWCESSGGKQIVSDPDALGAYLRDMNMTLRRTEDEVGKQMPPVNQLIHHVPYEAHVVDAFEAEARTLAQRVLEGSFTERGQAARDLDMRARHVTGVSKARGVAALVRLLVEGGLKVLLGGWHREVYDIWNECFDGLNPVMYTGTESRVAKRRAKEAFIHGDAGVMMMSLRSGAGLDGLQRVCHTAVIGEFDWSPLVHKQFIGRLRRPGQEHQVDGIYCPTNGGSDPVLMELLGLKSAQAQGITDPLAGAQPVHSDDSRIRKLAEAILERNQS